MWTYDIYRPLLGGEPPPTATTSAWGAGARFLGVVISIATAYLVMQFGQHMDYVQALFTCTPVRHGDSRHAVETRDPPQSGAARGTVSSVFMFLLVKFDPSKLAYIALSAMQKTSQNMYRALWSWVICVVVTVAVSTLHAPNPCGGVDRLVYGCTELPSKGHFRYGNGPFSGERSPPGS